MIGTHKINYIEANNYRGIIDILCDDINKIEWFLDGVKIKTKYNIIGEFNTNLGVEDLSGKEIYFVLIGDNGQATSKIFELLSPEVL